MKITDMLLIFYVIIFFSLLGNLGIIIGVSVGCKLDVIFLQPLIFCFF